jgi:hypothetical protein
MKKLNIFPNGILNSKGVSVLRGLIGVSNPAVATGLGIVEGVFNRFKRIPKDNKASIVGGQGNNNYWEYLGIAMAVILLCYTTYQLISGEISVDEWSNANKLPE